MLNRNDDDDNDDDDYEYFRKMFNAVLDKL